MSQGERSEHLLMRLAAPVTPISVVIKQEKDGDQLAEIQSKPNIQTCLLHTFQWTFVQWNV